MKRWWFLSKRMAQQTQVHRMASGLYGLTIGMNDGFSLGGQAFWKAVEEKKIEVKYANGNRVNLLKLRGDRIDCYVNDRISILWELTRLKREGIVDTVNFSMAAKISLEQGYIGFTNRNLEQYPYQSQFVAAFNSALAELKAAANSTRLLAAILSNVAPLRRQATAV